MTRPWVLVAFHFTCHPGRTKLQQAGLAAEAVPSSMAAKVWLENDNKKRHFIRHFVHASFLHWSFPISWRNFYWCHNNTRQAQSWVFIIDLWAQMYYYLFPFISHQALLLLLLQPLLIGMKSAIAQAIAQATYFLLAAWFACDPVTAAAWPSKGSSTAPAFCPPPPGGLLCYTHKGRKAMTTISSSWRAQEASLWG